MKGKSERMLQVYAYITFICTACFVLFSDNKVPLIYFINHWILSLQYIIEFYICLNLETLLCAFDIFIYTHNI